jgi:hypothetical protein
MAFAEHMTRRMSGDRQQHVLDCVPAVGVELRPRRSHILLNGHRLAPADDLDEIIHAVAVVLRSLAGVRVDTD